MDRGKSLRDLRASDLLILCVLLEFSATGHVPYGFRNMHVQASCGPMSIPWHTRNISRAGPCGVHAGLMEKVRLGM